MKALIKKAACFGIVLFLAACLPLPVQAAGESTFISGIYIEDMPLEGKTVAEAEVMVNDYVDGLLGKRITLSLVDGNECVIMPSDIGFRWSNQEILEEAISIGKKGNIVQRYKAEKDLQFENKVYPLVFAVDKNLVKQILEEQCTVYDVEAVNASLSRENDTFVIHQGQTGYKLDVNTSLSLICDYLTDGSWDGQDTSLALAFIEDKPIGTEEELSKVKDVLGSYTTSFSSSGPPRSANVRNGCELINGTTLYPDEEFSTYGIVSPFTSANGYYMAGSYLNGQVVDSIGGGICQVSTTLYNAVLLAELEVTERHNHSMIVSYVEPSADAAIAESAGKDFRFVNNTSAPIYIEGYTTEDKQIGFTIYGEETRAESRSVSYVSEVTSTTYPDTEIIYTNASAPIGSVSVQSAHIGYTANLWKVVHENGQEVSREKVNSSSYKVAPRSATVGIATEDPNALNIMMGAIATNSIDYVRDVAAALAAALAPPAPPAEAVPPAAPAAPAEVTPAPPAPPVETPAG